MNPTQLLFKLDNYNLPTHFSKEPFELDSVSKNRQYRAIGNAVPPVMMWHIATSLNLLINPNEKTERNKNMVNYENWQLDIFQHNKEYV